jgi:hypothetical protein
LLTWDVRSPPIQHSPIVSYALLTIKATLTRATCKGDRHVTKKFVKLGILAKGSYGHVSMHCPKTDENFCGINYRSAS